MTVIKASGRPEAFDLQKLTDSLVRSGADRDVAADVAARVQKQIGPSPHTRQIFRLAKKLLRQYNHASGMRYSLKSAIFSLGPSGFPFEKYFARILTAHGYSAELDRIIDGYCVKHEVDILAGKGSNHYVIECKYHTNGGKPTDVKVALYVHSRVEDIRKAYERNGGNAAIEQGWLVTNTRCSTDAIRFAGCVGLRIVSWRYPEKESLEKMIEEKRLYPITVLSSARKGSLVTLFERNIILARDIADMEHQDFITRSGLDARSAVVLKREADALCLAS
ncbi:MAG: restriction endonuclease [Nitrospirae bacterium]|nr:restriction endonuclease [Nitrospirota bacterium]